MKEWKEFPLSQLNDHSLEEMGAEYEKNGFCVLSEVGDDVAESFERTLAGILGSEQLRVDAASRVFSSDIRKRLSRVDTSADLKQLMISRFGPVLSKLIGPLVHVSSTFHSQFKNLSAKAVDHGGYDSGFDYMEVHGPYLLHQDFAGASFPTTPSMMIIWIPLNSSPDWNLQLYRGSHRLGLLCNTWMELNHGGLNEIGEAVNIQARKGQAVVFNAMTLHGTSLPGPMPRISCDIRFFPLCGFLPSEVHFLNLEPLQEIQRRLVREKSDVLQSPLFEDLVYLSAKEIEEPFPALRTEPQSVLNWVNYLSLKTRGREDQASEFLINLVNTEKGIDPPKVYIDKFHHHPIQWQTVQAVSSRLHRTDRNWREHLNQAIQTITPELKSAGTSLM
jgi:hypothetical protein